VTLYEIVVAPTGKAFPAGTPVRAIAPRPAQLSLALAVISAFAIVAVAWPASVLTAIPASAVRAGFSASPPATVGAERDVFRRAAPRVVVRRARRVARRIGPAVRDRRRADREGVARRDALARDRAEARAAVGRARRAEGRVGDHGRALAGRGVHGDVRRSAER